MKFNLFRDLISEWFLGLEFRKKMADHQKDQVDIKVSPGPIPQGWILVSETKPHGHEVEVSVN